MAPATVSVKRLTMTATIAVDKVWRKTLKHVIYLTLALLLSVGA